MSHSNNNNKNEEKKKKMKKKIIKKCTPTTEVCQVLSWTSVNVLVTSQNTLEGLHFSCNFMLKVLIYSEKLVIYNSDFTPQEMKCPCFDRVKHLHLMKTEKAVQLDWHHMPQSSVARNPWTLSLNNSSGTWQGAEYKSSAINRWLF